jgi:hypothetical protein
MRKSGMPQMSASPMASSLPMAQDKFSASNDPFAINFQPSQDVDFAKQWATGNPVGDLMRTDPNILGLASQIGYGSNLYGNGQDPLSGVTASQGADMFRRLSQFASNPDFRSTFFGQFGMSGMRDQGQGSAAEAMQAAYNNFLNRFRSTGQFGLSGSYTQGGY